jgi:hypothetical protein
MCTPINMFFMLTLSIRARCLVRKRSKPTHSSTSSSEFSKKVARRYIWLLRISVVVIVEPAAWPCLVYTVIVVSRRWPHLVSVGSTPSTSSRGSCRHRRVSHHDVFISVVVEPSQRVLQLVACLFSSTSFVEPPLVENRASVPVR